MKRLFLILLFIPAFSFSAPMQVEVDALTWDHNGVLATGFKMYCGGTMVLDVPDGTARELLIANGITADGAHVCDLTAYGADGFESPHSPPITIDITGGIAYITANVPTAPYGLKLIKK